MIQQAYQNARRFSERPRAVEHRLMTQITGEMINARAAGGQRTALMPALHRNREVWSAFFAACSTEGNRLPAQVRGSLISLALWVDRYTSDVVAGRESIDTLIDVNLAVIEGLAANGLDHSTAI